MRLCIGRLSASPPTELLTALEEIADRTDATIQAFDARYIVSRHHLERAVDLADRAIDRDDTIADDRGVEILLYAAGRRQIDEAFEMGLKESPHPIVVLIDGGDETAAADAVDERFDEVCSFEAVINDPDTIDAFFDITPTELSTNATREDLVLERVALLAINK